MIFGKFSKRDYSIFRIFGLNKNQKPSTQLKSKGQVKKKSKKTSKAKIKQRKLSKQKIDSQTKQIQIFAWRLDC
ncbi:hypothetical protein CQA40_04195 [Helicobacter sp. MIT 01-3238]|nr:hypothetical protein CQA40_04195 [Helicobacter sp. MIT 01-3238]